MTSDIEAYCRVCGTGELEVISEYRALPRATSDSKPWPAGGRLTVCSHCGAVQKIPDAQWLEEIGRIYAEYEIYQQSAGAEQLIFNSGGRPEPRSSKLVSYIREQVSLPVNGRLLDIGCGNGAALRSFSRLLPNWTLYGSELSDTTIESLKNIPGFVDLFVGDLAEVRERFTMISIIHTLEHVLSPSKVLENAANLLGPDGVLFIEVPDIETSPFDLLVADHLLHFSRETLRFLLERAGFRPLTVRNDVITKEITALAVRKPGEGTSTHSGLAEPRVRGTVAWLQEVFASAERMAKHGPLAIFGTAIAGMALYGAIRESVPFFVDEDPNRIGRRCDGKPIVAPADAARDIPVFLAFPPATAQAVAARCGQYGLRCILPPPAMETA